jgi:hypothetical protein
MEIASHLILICCILQEKRAFVSSKLWPAVSGSKIHVHNIPKKVITAKNQNVPIGWRASSSNIDGTA